MKVKIFLLTGSIGLISSPLFAVDYYISSSQGNDAWSGQLSAPNAANSDGPKQTLAAAQGLIPTVHAGDQVLFRRGDTWSESATFFISNANGTSTLPTVIGAYGSGARPRWAFSSGGAIIHSPPGQTTRNMVLEGIRISYVGPTESGSGLNINDSVDPMPADLRLSNMEFDGRFNFLVVNYANRLILENSHFHDSLGTGFITDGITQDVVFRNNLLENIGDRQNINYFYHVFYLNGTDILVENNTVRYCHDAMKIRGGNRVIVRGNIIHDCAEGGIHGGGDAIGNHLQNSILENNTIYETGLGITFKGESGPGPLSNVIVRNNIVHSKRVGSYGGLFNVGDVTVNGLYVYNNLFYDPRANPAINIVTPNPQNFFFRNNIVVKTDFSNSSAFINIYDPPNLAGLTLENNIYSGAGAFMQNGPSVNFSSLNSFRQTFPSQETSSLNATPTFVSEAARNFHLTSGSIGIDSGFDVGSAVPLDFDGVGRPQGNGYDAGPFEYSVGGPTNVRPSVNAGSNQSLSYPANSATLVGAIVDDGLPDPPARVTSQWSQESGPGTASFANAASPLTTVTFSQPGTYVLRLTANDSALTATDDVQITVNGEGGGSGNGSGNNQAVTETKLVSCSNPQDSAERSRIPVCFDVKESGNVSITIYSRQGKKVRELLNGHRDAGENRMDWDLKDDAGSSVSSGSYVAIFEADGVKQKIRLAVIR